MRASKHHSRIVRAQTGKVVCNMSLSPGLTIGCPFIDLQANNQPSGSEHSRAAFFTAGKMRVTSEGSIRHRRSRIRTLDHWMGHRPRGPNPSKLEH